MLGEMRPAGYRPTPGAVHQLIRPRVPRFPLHFQAVAELHAVVVMFPVGPTVATFFVLRLGAVGRRVFRAYAMLLAAIVLQGAVGYFQYFAGLPVDLIEIHIVGAGVLAVIASVRWNLVAELIRSGVAPEPEIGRWGHPCRRPAAR